ncbi:hypothetical protein [Cryobacterium sp. GrIS_2_6]|uniref:hypothetical protein n=1 Tax=Cryobacterium sp. GrIS_2_6 TaxID=3162785 RepID=UPI002E024B11|nr:hypothetical protein [Cryobacterium psychrotolerans]MEC5149218.1 hypothetical protein [Cryobacterium psychrotolerans]MEC5149299.1 hypothetical protein [Cryobacterium psychrotolerans]
MVETFRVFAYDLNTNTRLTELSVQNLSFDTRLNDSGSIGFEINLQNPDSALSAGPILSYDGIPFAVYVDRNGTIVWGGIVWTGAFARSSGMLPVTGKEFGSHFNQRVIAADYSAITYPAGIDPAQLVFKAYTDAQNVALCGPGASIGLTVVGGTSTIPPFIPGYPVTQHTTVSQVAADMASVSAPGAGSVDTTITCYWDANGNPQRVLRIWSPRAGRTAAFTGLAFDMTSCLDYTWPTDATKMGTTIIATGSGTGAATPTATVYSAAPVGGLGQAPRLDQVISFSNVESVAQVTAMANGYALLNGLPVATPTLTQPTAAEPQLGSWLAGDDARLWTPGDGRFPNGKDQFWRIIQFSTKVPDAGVATVTLTFNRPPII